MLPPFTPTRWRLWSPPSSRVCFVARQTRFREDEKCIRTTRGIHTSVNAHHWGSEGCKIFACNRQKNANKMCFFSSRRPRPLPPSHAHSQCLRKLMPLFIQSVSLNAIGTSAKCLLCSGNIKVPSGWVSSMFLHWVCPEDFVATASWKQSKADESGEKNGLRSAATAFLKGDLFL